jgi:hypothetical protein
MAPELRSLWVLFIRVAQLFRVRGVPLVAVSHASIGRRRARGGSLPH